MQAGTGPLRGFRIVEIAGIGPGQFCGMLLADMGADVLRVVRPDSSADGIAIPAKANLMNRGRTVLAADLKTDDGRAMVLGLCRHADALFEGFRPGVMERLGLGPADCQAVNARLVYGRMTGWGQDGPLAASAGHDGNYLARAGALHAIGERDGLPVLPLNLVGDFGGGGAFLALGLLAALLETSRSGEGQVVDAAMVDGIASLMTLFHGLQSAGLWRDARGRNFLDGGAPFYRCYRTADDKAIVVCALENRFFRELLDVLGTNEIDANDQYREDLWPRHAECLARIFESRTRDDWSARFVDIDACVSPVLSLDEARNDAHLAARQTFIDVDGVVQPAPAPRFSRTPGRIRSAPGVGPCDPRSALRDWGLEPDAITELMDSGARPAAH